MKHVMVDLETLSTRPDAMIVSIGAAAFTPQDGVIDTFYQAIDVNSIRALADVSKFHVDHATLDWWANQPIEAAREWCVQSPLQCRLPEALALFAQWFAEIEGYFVWGNGATFDNVILRNAYTALGMSAPWKYTADRCFRTTMNTFGYPAIERSGVHHNARDDAVYQVECLLASGWRERTQDLSEIRPPQGGTT